MSKSQISPLMANNTTHSTEAPSERTTRRNTSTFCFVLFFVGVGPLHGLYICYVQFEKFVKQNLFFLPTHARRPYSVHVQLDRTVLYVSCTKINVAHLSAGRTKNSVQSNKQLGLQTALTVKGKHTLKYTHTHNGLRSNAMEDEQTTDLSTQMCVCVCICVCVCVQMKSCLWSFCTESMKQAWLLNRVFIHSGLW